MKEKNPQEKYELNFAMSNDDYRRWNALTKKIGHKNMSETIREGLMICEFLVDNPENEDAFTALEHLRIDIPLANTPEEETRDHRIRLEFDMDVAKKILYMKEHWEIESGEELVYKAMKFRETLFAAAEGNIPVVVNLNGDEYDLANHFVTIRDPYSKFLNFLSSPFRND